MASKYVEFGKLLGLEFKVSEELTDDFMFVMDTMQLCETLDGACGALEVGEQLELVMSFFTDFAEDLTRGIDKGWFEPLTTQAIIAKAKAKGLEAKAKMA